MKKIIFSLIVLAAGTMVFAQNGYNRSYNSSSNNNAYTTTPSKVQKGWQGYHPSNSNVSPDWSKGNKQWDAHYTDQTTNRSVDEYYNKRGKMIDTHREWNKNDLPGGFDNRVWDRYRTRDYTVNRIDRPSNTSLFQLSLNLGVGNTKIVYVDEQGNEVRYRDRH